MSRYLVCDGWTHIFDEDGIEKERTTRFVFNVQSQTLVVLDIMRDNKWREASKSEKADLLDSLINANPDALANPASWDIETSNTIPEWR